MSVFVSLFVNPSAPQVVRDAALRTLLRIANCLPPLFEDKDFALEMTKRLLVATLDVSEDNK